MAAGIVIGAALDAVVTALAEGVPRPPCVPSTIRRVPDTIILFLIVAFAVLLLV